MEHTDRFRAFWLGVFVIAAAALITWLVLFLRPSVGDGEKTLKIRFSNIEKVSVGTRVTFAGKPVGEVIEINEIDQAREQPTDSHGNIYFYELVVRVDSRVKIYNYDEIIFSTAGLLGEKTIAIIPKQAPPGSPPATEDKDGVLYARSSDKLDETLTKLLDVADVFEQTMCEMLCFFKENSEEIHTALHSFNVASHEVGSFFTRANQCDLAGSFADAMTKVDTTFKQALDGDLIPTFTDAIKNFRSITGQVASGQGTLGNLLYNRNFYFQVEMTMNRLEEVLSDIRNYGLFFQFDSDWRRQRRMRAMQMQNLSGDRCVGVQEEFRKVSGSLSRVGKAMKKMRSSGKFERDPKFEELVRQIEELEKNMKETSESFTKTNKELVTN